MKRKTKVSCALIIVVLICYFITYHLITRYELNEERTFILPQSDYPISIDYMSLDSAIFKLPPSDYTLEVYCDSWFQIIPCMPGNSSDVPCIVKLKNNKTGKCLHKEKFTMLQLLYPIIITSNNVEIGKFTTWEF